MNYLFSQPFPRYRPTVLAGVSALALMNMACTTTALSSVGAATAATASARPGMVKNVIVAPRTAPPATLFSRQEVRLLPGVFQNAQNQDKNYLLHLDTDRLLSYVRKNAGLTPKAKPYGGWDSGGASTIGHYLSACSLMYGATGDPRLKKRVDYVVSELVEAQKAGGDGGIYAFEWDKTHFFHDLKAGKVTSGNVNGWYITHKIFAGLRDAALEANSSEARTALIRMTDWAISITATLTPEQWQVMLNAEHGGPHEVFADVYAMTGDRKYLDFAENFKHEKVFAPLAQNDDAVLNGLHANTQVPKFIGYERIYEETGDASWHLAAQNFFDNVTAKRSWSNGGNSQWEAFFAPQQAEDKVLQNCGPETCNTYNMLKLGTRLYCQNPTARYMDYHERALYNHILPSLAPDREGGFVYYTSQRPGHYRVFSSPHDAFWCCVGTGLENPAKYVETIYAHQGSDKLFVNLFIPSTLDWRETGVKLRQTNNFPAKAETQLTVTSSARSGEWTLAVRHPDWVSPQGLKITINGKPANAMTGADGYATIKRAWKTGDTVVVFLPMTLSAEPLTGSDKYVSFRYGPLVLGAKLGTQGLTKADFEGAGEFNNPSQLATKAIPAGLTPILMDTFDGAARHVKPMSGKSLTFALTGTTAGDAVTLVPFNEIFYERYAVYFRLADAQTAQSMKQQAEDEVRDAASLASRTRDRVRPGDEESEKAHNLQSDQSHSSKPSSESAPGWRDANASFSYELAVSPTEPNAVRAQYWGADNGRTFEILAGDTVIGKASLTGAAGPNAIYETYPIPVALTQNKTKIRITFRALPGSIAGGVWDVRTIRLLPAKDPNPATK